MIPIALTVNGRPVAASVEPRTSLADFLREQLLLTGTHLGCEHGVCGACTVTIDDAPARSCIAFAVACDGMSIRTIEGFDDDPVMTRLRAAFTAEHALQCGYCTPGMLVSARDIVTRLPDADDARIREELAGNLCRCTGYVGIVRAVRGVLGEPPAPIEPVPAMHPVAAPIAAPKRAAASAVSLRGGTTIEQSIWVPFPPDQVWAALKDIPEVAACMPGVVVDGPPVDGRVAGRLTVRLGPMAASFAGTADIAFDEAARSGRIAGRGRDGGSAAEGEVHFTLTEVDDGSRIDVAVAYRLTGTFAQFGRSGLVQDVADRMTAAFAANLRSLLAAEDVGVRQTEIRGVGLLFGYLWRRLRRRLGF